MCTALSGVSGCDGAGPTEQARGSWASAGKGGVGGGGVTGAQEASLPVKERLRNALQGFPLNLAPSAGYDMVAPGCSLAVHPAHDTAERVRGGGSGGGRLRRKGCQGSGGEVGGSVEESEATGRGQGDVRGELRTTLEAGTAREAAESAEEYSQRLVYIAAKALALAARGDEATHLAGGGSGGSKSAVEDMNAVARAKAGASGTALVLQGDGDGEVVPVDIAGFVPVHEIGMAVRQNARQCACSICHDPSQNLKLT